MARRTVAHARAACGMHCETADQAPLRRRGAVISALPVITGTLVVLAPCGRVQQGWLHPCAAAVPHWVGTLWTNALQLHSNCAAQPLWALRRPTHLADLAEKVAAEPRENPCAVNGNGTIAFVVLFARLTRSGSFLSPFTVLTRALFPLAPHPYPVIPLALPVSARAWVGRRADQRVRLPRHRRAVPAPDLPKPRARAPSASVRT